MKSYSFIFLLLFVGGISSCIDTELVDDFQRIEIKSGIPVRSLAFISRDTIIAGGGIKNNYGFIAMSTNGGNSWNTQWENPGKCIYTLGFTDMGKGMAGGDSLFMLQSFDRGITWMFYWIGDSVPRHSFNRPSFRNISSRNNYVLMVAGENFKKGVYYLSKDNGRTWSFRFYPHEMTGVCLHDSISIATGNGIILQGQVQKSFQPEIIDFQGDFLTDAALFKSNFLISARSASIYIYHPASGLLKKLKSPGLFNMSSAALTSITCGENLIVAGGDRGYFCWSRDHGHSWHEAVLPDKADIKDINIKNGFIWFACTNGFLYRITETSLKPR